MWNTKRHARLFFFGGVCLLFVGKVMCDWCHEMSTMLAWTYMEINGNVQETWEQKKHDNVVEFDVALDEEKEQKKKAWLSCEVLHFRRLPTFPPVGVQSLGKFISRYKSFVNLWYCYVSSIIMQENRTAAKETKKNICSKTLAYLADCNARSEEPQAANDCREDQPWWTEIVTKCDNAETVCERISTNSSIIEWNSRYETYSKMSGSWHTWN